MMLVTWVTVSQFGTQTDWFETIHIWGLYSEVKHKHFSVIKTALIAYSFEFSSTDAPRFKESCLYSTDQIIYKTSEGNQSNEIVFF